MMSQLFWLSDRQWTAIEPLIPRNRPGVRPRRNREVISGIVHVLRTGCRWQDCSAAYGPPTTVYNRFHRWAQRGIWQQIFEQLVRFEAVEQQCVDSCTVRAHRSAVGGKGGRRTKLSASPEVGAAQRSMPWPTASDE